MTIEKLQLSSQLSKKNPEKFIKKGTLLEQRRGDIDPVSLPFRRLNSEVYNDQHRKEDHEYIVGLIGWLGIVVTSLVLWCLILWAVGVL